MLEIILKLFDFCIEFQTSPFCAKAFALFCLASFFFYLFLHFFFSFLNFCFIFFVLFFLFVSPFSINSCFIVYRNIYYASFWLSTLAQTHTHTHTTSYQFCQHSRIWQIHQTKSNNNNNDNNSDSNTKTCCCC